MGRKRYRVAQWGTGHPMRSLQTVLDHPQYDLVGLRVYSDAKVGRDAGEIAGLDENTGVIATRNIEDILAARPDCVIYMPMLDHTSIDDMCRLLECGINIVTTSTEFFSSPDHGSGASAQTGDCLRARQVFVVRDRSRARLHRRQLPARGLVALASPGFREDHPVCRFGRAATRRPSSRSSSGSTEPRI